MGLDIAVDPAKLLKRIQQIKCMDFKGWHQHRIASVALELEALEKYMQEYGKLLFFKPNPAQEKFLNPEGRKDLPRVRLFIGGNRCLGAETVVDAAGKMTVGELFEKKQPFEVLAWDEFHAKVVKTWAMPPFEKGMSQLYKVTLRTGEWFVASAEHRVLSSFESSGRATYLPVSELRVGSLLSRRQSTSEHDLSVLPPNGIHSTDRVQDCRDYCSAYRRLCDEQLRKEQGSALDASPSLGGVQEHIYDGDCGHRDAWEDRQAHTHHRPDACHRSNSDDLRQSAGRAVGIEYPVSCKPARCTFQEDLECNLSAYASFRLQSIQQEAQRHTDVSVSPFPSSVYDAVISIEPVRIGVKYDFHVPVFNNYWAGGCFHHNSGKTEILVYEGISFALGERLWSGQRLPVRVPNRGRICVTSYLDGGKKVLEPKLRRIIPPALLEGGSWSKGTKVGQQGCVVEVKFANGSWFDVVSSEQESMKHEGADMDWFGFDEPLSREHWIANWRGLTDRSGYAMGTLTPLTEPWIKEELWDKQFTEPDLYYAFKGSTYDNVGYGLTRQGIKDFESQLTEDEKQTRIEGNFLILQGMVYKEYRDQLFDHDQAMAGNVSGHLIEPFSIPEDWPRFVSIDPHDRTPTHVIWAAVDPHDDIYIYDEMAIGGKSVTEIAEEIKKREELHDEPGFRVVRLIDPASKQEKGSVEVGMSIYDMFMRAGIYCYLPNHDITPGHKSVREYLRFQKTIRGFRPRMFIFKTLRGVRRSIMNYVYDDRGTNKGSNKDYREPKDNKVREKDKHYPDTIRYLCVFGPKYWHRREEKRQRIGGER